MRTKNPFLTRLGQTALLAVVAATFAMMAGAQDFAVFSGNSGRSGLPVDVNAGAFAPNIYNDSGRNFLRWWDPASAVTGTLDNDEVSGVGSTFSTGSWVNATLNKIVAFGYYQRILGVPIYRYTGLVKGTNASDATAGASASYFFEFTGLNSSDFYETYLNLPVGPTDVGNFDLRFPQKYWVVKISGVQGGDKVDVIDYDRRLGGFVRLGNDGNETTRTFQPLNDRIRITLYNTAPINGNGTFLDPNLQADPTLLGRQLVYADGARLVSLSKAGPGKYAATPIVHQMQAAPPGGGTENFPVRTVATRNEELTVGDQNRKYEVGVTTSYDFRGGFPPQTFRFRYNKVWSWPFRRPFDNSDAEYTRAARDFRDWVMATGKNRSDQKIQIDNLSAGYSSTAGFTVAAGTPDNIGPTYTQSVLTSGNATEQAVFGGNLPEGNYFVEVWRPGAGGGTQVQLNIQQGGTVVDSLDLDQSGAKGWFRVPFQPAKGYTHTDLAQLKAIITNHTNNPADSGRIVYADAVRFVRQSDLKVESTPLQTTTSIQTTTGPVNRDVTLLALENGKIYCVDAHGDEATGAPPQVYWTYPTEDPTNDPNNSPAEDGKDNIAEPPYAFDLTSALVANVGGEDLLYIASRNGKIYCLEMTGRGDGTTRRRWTYPDDYDPTLPSLPMKTGFRPILGSLAFGTALGTPMIIVGTQEGRIIALNAAGNATRKTTSVVWQYPPLISAVSGPIEMTPVVAFGRVYYGTTPTPTSTAGRIIGLDLGTGFPVFQQDGATIGGFAKFGAASPVAVPGTMLANGGANWDKTINDFGNDRLFVCDSAGKFASLNVLTGAIIWSTTELTVGAAGPLRFSFTTMPDNTSVLEQDVPLVYVPDFGGRINGMNARGNRNRKSTTRVWSAKLAGDNQIATLATGGYSPPSGNPHSWLYTGDTLGNLYAFNSVNDTQVQPILPGIPPIVDIIDDNDSSLDELNNAIDPAKFKLISPEQYDRLRELSDNNGGIITSQIVQDIANNHSIDRRYYDFGETLYILIYDLPNGTGPNAGYYVDFEISSAGRSPQHRPQPLRSYTVGNGNYVIAGLPLMTNGVGGVGPGPNFLTAKAVAPGNRNLQGTEYHLPKPASWVVTPDGDAVDFYIANPLSLAFTGDDGRTVTESVTLNNLTNPLYKIQTDYAANQNRWLIFNRNGNDRIDQGTGGVTEPRGPLGPDLVSKGQAVSHGNPGVQQLQVADRSLMTLVMGRGMAGVRVGPRDIAWVKAVGDPTGGIYKPLSTNVNYPGFEDFPINVPNTSQDYPDVARDRMSITSNLLGQAQNPLYVSGVDLEGPGFSTAQLQTYRVKAGYEAQMDRQINLTTFDVSLAVPKYQPPSQQGYYGSQLVFVDYQNGNPNFDPTQSSFRTFGLGLGVAVDEHLVFQTPTVDLASLPSGGGFNGGPGNGPLNPWDPATFFSPWDTNFNNLFQPFTVYNEGNVNILNLRMAKYFHDTNGNRPVELFMPGQQELAWLDASLHMHTSIDPRFSASLRVGPGQIGYDAQGRNILQKPRPLDLTGTRYNVNPKSRPNSGLRIVGSYLYNQAVVPPGDAKIGVSAPIGSPAGEYIRRIFAFENNDTTNDPNPQNPSLGTQEPYTDPGLNLKFIVRESRVTNAPTQKSAPLVENIMSPADVFGWSNTQPTSMRDGLGNIFTAWSSDRVDTNNNAAWVPKQRLEGDLLVPSKWRVYVASLRSILGNVLGESPIGELNAWSADTANRWFRQVLVVDPLGTMANPFNLGPGETLDAASVKFGAPVFPTGGFFNQLDDPAQSGRQWFTGRYMTFIGEATKFDAAGNATQVNMIFAAPMVFNADGSITFDPGDMVSSPYDVTSKKSRPALTLQRTGSRDALTIYTSSVSNGNGQITWHRYNSAVPPDQRWSLGSVRLGRSFEQVGAPSVSLHRYRNGTDGQHPYNQAYVTFSGKVKGRRFSDVYQLRLRVDSNGWPSGRNPVMPYGNLTGNGQPNPDVPFIDELTLDPSTGTYWAPGLQWITNNQTILDRIDIGTSSAYNTGNYRFTNSIWDNNVQTRDFDSRNGILKFNSTKGGEVVIDTVTGSVRFNGAILTRGTRLFINYRPTLIRLADGAGSNYRSVASAYDDRFIGIRVDQANPQRNLIGDLLYWLNSANNQAGVNDPLRWDRTVIAYTRTSGDGTASTRPFYQTFRFGVKLQNGIQTDVNGRPTNFSVTFGGGNAGEQFCQIDPASGRVFFMSGYEDRVVTVRYNAVDEAGRLIGQRTEELLVRVIPEIDEQALPIEQVGNESALSISLDPLNGTFNDISPVTGRRPGLIWLFWTSTRNGQPDIFFETIAPRFSPRRAEQ